VADYWCLNLGKSWANYIWKVIVMPLVH